ncbi:hypothetical protein [Serratia marcescens]|uniref:hypothetical protein n=1 Tax=Serratia marcescens TaxID=615 RepID=UPI002882618C|nr:hypothetical protein [Serratia marcescens]MDT0208527.1 hypothetical protein [Serratia marcescens]
MIIVHNTVFDLDYKDIVDPRIALITDTMMAGYDCLSNRDFSGRDNHFSWGGGYNSQGAILADDANHVIQTPVIEEDEMTIITCWNLSSGSTQASLINNLDTSTTAYRGTRLSRLSGSQGQFDIATGIATPPVTSSPIGVAGAWTIRAITWNKTTYREIFHSGTISRETPLTNGRAKNVSRGFSVNGVPAGVSGGGITAGVTGTLGFLLFYNEYIDPAVAKSRMDAVTDIMNYQRAVIVP